MLPEIASLDGRMSRGGDWMKWRDEIANLYRRAQTQEEYVTLLRAHSILGSLAEQVYDQDTFRKIKDVHYGEYLSYLNKEASENGDQINPAMLARISEREVAAGRLGPEDDFRQFASAGGRVLGDTAHTSIKSARPGDRVTLAFSVLALILWALSVHPFGISALWVIPLAFVAGAIANVREMKQIKQIARLERARRGY